MGSPFLIKLTLPYMNRDITFLTIANQILGLTAFIIPTVGLGGLLQPEENLSSVDGRKDSHLIIILHNRCLGIHDLAVNGGQRQLRQGNSDPRQDLCQRGGRLQG